MAERVVQRHIRICHVEVLLDQAARQVLRAFAVPAHMESLVRRLAPDVWRRTWPRPRLDVHRVIGEDSETGNNVFAEILVLVVTPDHDEIRPEVVEPRAD